jgi:NTE family protein
MPDALVLAGAVAKGAFTAGALAVLTDPTVKDGLGLDVQRIVGTSSGAVNALYYAAALRSGRDANAGAQLACIWIEQGSADRVFDISLRALLSGRGVSSHRGLLKLLRQHIQARPGHHPVDLRMVVTSLDGTLTEIGGELATLFERVVRFGGPELDTPEGIERAIRVAVASAALPGVFSPYELSSGGRLLATVDGGLTDNAPLTQALRGGFDADRVFVITHVPRVLPRLGHLRGIALASHLLDILVQERLGRELRAVETANAALAELQARVANHDDRAALLDALGLTGRRPVCVIEIRPPVSLPGNALSGFFSRRLRQQYVQAGIDATLGVLGEWL